MTASLLAEDDHQTISLLDLCTDARKILNRASGDPTVTPIANSQIL